MNRRPPISTLSPYTSLFCSVALRVRACAVVVPPVHILIVPVHAALATRGPSVDTGIIGSHVGDVPLVEVSHFLAPVRVFLASVQGVSLPRSRRDSIFPVLFPHAHESSRL